MLLNLRGTNGSGKTTVIRGIMEKATSTRPIYGLLGARKPEAYELKLPKVAKPVYLIGPYNTETGGCDAIQPYDLILELLEKYAAKGHVLFEGVLISSSYGRVGTLMERWGQEAVMAFLDTPLEVCIKHTELRRTRRGDDRPFNPHNLTSKYKQVQKSKPKIKEAGRLRVFDLNWKKGTRQALELLETAK